MDHATCRAGARKSGSTDDVTTVRVEGRNDKDTFDTVFVVEATMVKALDGVTFATAVDVTIEEEEEEEERKNVTLPSHWMIRRPQSSDIFLWAKGITELPQ